MQQQQPIGPAGPMDPARAAYLRATAAALVGATVSRMLGDLDSTGSTSSAGERMMLRVLTPWIPKLRDGVLSRLSETPAEELERWMGAASLAIESILSQAPGEPQPRYAIGWDAGGSPVLVPIDEAPCAECEP